MKKKYLIFIFIFMMLVFFTYIFIINYFDNEIEISSMEPQEEISIEQERETSIKIFYYNSEKNIFEFDESKVDVKNLMDEPYNYILNLCLEKNLKNEYKENEEEMIKANSIFFDETILHVDFNDQLIKKLNEEEIKNFLEAISKSFFQLNEINIIKVTVNNEENMVVKNIYEDCLIKI